MDMEVSRSTVMARRFELDAEIDATVRRHKQELAPLQEELQLCERFIKESMLAANEQQIKIDGVGQTYFTTKTGATVGDMSQVIHYLLAAAPPADILPDPTLWPDVLRHIESHALWSLLNNAVNKTVVKEIIEKEKSPPPGVKYVEFRDLAWRKA